jgi:hypothetical protein
MAKFRTRSPESTEPTTHATSRDREPVTSFVPTLRRWLIALAALVTLPWLIVGGALLGPQRLGITSAEPEPMLDAPPGRIGPWGRLVTTPITISPPLDYIPTDLDAGTPLEWSFPNVTASELERLLVSVGVSQPDAAYLRGTMKTTPALNAVVVSPTPELVMRLSPEARARIYVALGRLGAYVNNRTINRAQATAYRFSGTSPQTWLGPLLSPDTTSLVEPLIYRNGAFLYFADLDLVRGRIPNPAEFQLLVKRLLRQRTVLVRLILDDHASVSDVGEYWGRGGRKTDLLPLLESVEEGAGAASARIDVVHLLPGIARQYLYRYPRPTLRDVGQSPLTNCLWTAFNFFEEVPEQLDQRYLDPEYGRKRLNAEYFVVYDNLQLGDIAAFWDEQGRLVHVAVHVADGLFFTKNGSSELAPWTILPLSELDGHFVEYAHAWRVTYHRSKDT